MSLLSLAFIVFSFKIASCSIAVSKDNCVFTEILEKLFELFLSNIKKIDYLTVD